MTVKQFEKMAFSLRLKGIFAFINITILSQNIANSQPNPNYSVARFGGVGGGLVRAGVTPIFSGVEIAAYGGPCIFL